MQISVKLTNSFIMIYTEYMCMSNATYPHKHKPEYWLIAVEKLRTSSLGSDLSEDMAFSLLGNSDHLNIFMQEM